MISQESLQKYFESLDIVCKSISKGGCIVMFPEGARTSDGQLQEFKKGPFILALRAQAIIVPITINGSFRILKKGSLEISPGIINLVIHDPIFTEGINGIERESHLRFYVREKIKSAYIDQSNEF